jgi:hypothetical protein
MAESGTPYRTPGAVEALHEANGIPRDTDWLAEAVPRISAVR